MARVGSDLPRGGPQPLPVGSKVPAAERLAVAVRTLSDTIARGRRDPFAKLMNAVAREVERVLPAIVSGTRQLADLSPPPITTRHALQVLLAQLEAGGRRLAPAAATLRDTLAASDAAFLARAETAAAVPGSSLQIYRARLVELASVARPTAAADLLPPPDISQDAARRAPVGRASRPKSGPTSNVGSRAADHGALPAAIRPPPPPARIALAHDVVKERAVPLTTAQRTAMFSYLRQRGEPEPVIAALADLLTPDPQTRRPPLRFSTLVTEGAALAYTQALEQGSFGRFHEAYDLVADRPCALKRLRLRGKPASQAQWQKPPDTHLTRPSELFSELEIMARVGSPLTPNMVLRRGNKAYLVMPLSTAALAALVRTVPPEAAGALAREAMRQIGGQLAGAHAAGVIHRDVKVDNVLWDAAGRLVLADWGLAAVEDPATKSVPSGRGTPLAMPREAFAADRVTAAMDVYGLGILMLAMVGGRYPHRYPHAKEMVASMEMFERVVAELPKDSNGRIDVEEVARLDADFRARNDRLFGRDPAVCHAAVEIVRNMDGPTFLALASHLPMQATATDVVRVGVGPLVDVERLHAMATGDSACLRPLAELSAVAATDVVRELIALRSVGWPARADAQRFGFTESLAHLLDQGPAVATFVLAGMLHGDPARRPSAARVAAFFAGLPGAATDATTARAALAVRLDPSDRRLPAAVRRENLAREARRAGLEAFACLRRRGPARPSGATDRPPSER